MSSVQDIVTSLEINCGISVALVVLYAILKNQPANCRIYYAKYIQMGQKNVGPQPSDTKWHIGRYINLSARTYLHVMDWVKSSLKMPEAKLIEHAGLDSAIYLRIILLGIQIFLPMMVYSFAILVPVNVTDHWYRNKQRDTSSFTYSALDTITISNVQDRSKRLWAHIIAAYVYTAWTCWLLFRAYHSIVELRFTFLAAQERRPDQFTILCRCIPEDPEQSVQQHVDSVFRFIHPDYYLLNSVVYDANKLAKLVAKKESYKNKLTYWEGVVLKRPTSSRPSMKKGFLGLYGERVDRLDFYTETIEDLTVKIREERIKVLEDKDSVMPAAFVSFENRWAAAVCSQTKQSKDSSKWLTGWAPEPRDVYWGNLPIPYLQLTSRKIATMVLLVLLIIFFLIPVTFVQSLANLDNLEKNISFLKPIIDTRWKSVVQGFLPGLTLKIFLAIMPTVLWYMSTFEGHDSYSKVDRHACISYLAFMLINVFLGNVATGTAFEQLKLYIESPAQIPNVLGSGIPQRSTFFITYIIVDGWTNCALDLIRIWPFIWYHFQNVAIVRTEKDKDKATPVGFINYTTCLPRLGLYFLLGFVYSTISPLILPFILIFLAVAYVVYRNQIINAYNQRYESSGGYWPIMFAYVLIGLLVMQITLIGLMALKKASSSTPFLLPLPCCTLLFWYYCKSRFDEAFRCYPLAEAKAKDTAERAQEPELNHRDFLETAYMHPALRATLTGDVDDSDSEAAVGELLQKPVISARRHSDDDTGYNLGSVSQKILLSESNSTQNGRESTEVDQKSPRASPNRSRLGHNKQNGRESTEVDQTLP